MDGLMNLAKKGMDSYQKSQSDVSKTGGQEYNSPHHSGQHSSGGHDRPQFDDDEVVRTAEKEGSGSSDLFSTALGFLGSNKDKHTEPIDEDEIVENHNRAYGKGDASGMNASSLGSAAALQTLKQFTGGGKSSGGGGSQTQLISLAMAEATKLFDKSGGAANGNKQDAVNGAAMTVMKLLVQSKYGGGTTGGGNSGGLGSMMSLASKFM
ncbi:hypothetical protein CPB83DRAFT_25033 [Crepidotus variabilis]|uniref:DUF7721 domain-containing protein n=1 Tax=Crepidotus variabilis TaxID=179855 RepID=A0A9P6EUC2_9AGAR|nr:hypothetical protein CPB83DRAFT_25033 [Crepidotus variabilis]